MPNDFAGLNVKPGESTDIVKTVDHTPAPDKPMPPKPPAGWDKISYHMARAMRKDK
jgi:hypothetical protein